MRKFNAPYVDALLEAGFWFCVAVDARDFFGMYDMGGEL